MLCTELIVRGVLAVPPAPVRHLHAVPDVLPRVHRRPDIQQRKLVAPGLHRATVVVVDNIANFLPTAVDDPVMAVKGKFIPNRNTNMINKYKQITSASQDMDFCQ